MHGLPADFDSSFFVGLTLDSVGFSVNTVHLDFDHDVSVTCESSYEYVVNAQVTFVETLPESRSGLMVLVGRKIIHAEGREDGALVLSFEGAGHFICYDPSPQYEAYHIRRGNTEIHV
jgi:hypothetical protein